MRQTRRNFFLSAALLPSSLGLPGGIFAAQNPPTPPPKPQPGYTPTPAEMESHPGEAAAARRARLLENEKEFRLGVARLYQLTSDLRNEVEKTPTADIFSLHIVKETEEIAKLAKSIKSRARAA